MMMVDHDFTTFILRVKQKTRIDLAQYKEDQMKRRLISLYKKHGYGNFDSFFKGMDTDPSLLYEFLDHITINVTNFFRNPSQWEILQKSILPRLIKERGRIKSWSAACSTGEEPYSLAMIYHHMNIEHDKILATDLDKNVLSKASEGIYSEKSLEQVPALFRNKYFNRIDKDFEIPHSIKNRINFKKQNLLTDSFDSNYDLIVCRNVMIYFTEETKDYLYQKFSAALRPGGVLFVGSTEQIFKPERFSFNVEETFFYKKCR